MQTRETVLLSQGRPPSFTGMEPHGEAKGEPLLAAKFWILYSIYCSVAGWILSALHFLNRPGWLVSIGLFLWLLTRIWGFKNICRWKSPISAWKRRWRRPLPFCFLILCVLVLLRSISNPGIFGGGDFYGYRLPRVLHWIHDQRWSWISGTDVRFNNRGSGFEWMEVPLILFASSDRWISLLTAIPFFLLPGLSYITFRNLGIGSRVAWTWIWIIPGTYCILIQAGTGFTDGMSAFYALAAIGFSLQARRSKNVNDLYFGLLAAAFLTNLRISNLPLLLPIGLAMWPSWRLLEHRYRSTALVVAAALLASFIPNAIANIIYLRDWTGLASEWKMLEPVSPFVTGILNCFLVLVYGVIPPVLPIGAKGINSVTFLRHSIFGESLAHGFENDYGFVPRFASEQYVGLGWGVTLLLIPLFFSSLWSWIRGRKKNDGNTSFLIDSLIVWGGWIGMIPLLLKSTLFALPRVLAPYYPLLPVPFLRARSAGIIVKNIWWRRIAAGHLVVCMGVLMLSTDAPAWPMKKVVCLAQPYLSKRPSTQSLLDTYSYHWKWLEFQRSVALALPSEKEIGLCRQIQEESPLWFPYGSRLITHVLPEDTGASLSQKGIRHVLVTGEIGLDSLLKRLDASVEKEFLFESPRVPKPIHYFLLRIGNS